MWGQTALGSVRSRVAWAEWPLLLIRRQMVAAGGRSLDWFGLATRRHPRLGVRRSKRASPPAHCVPPTPEAAGPTVVPLCARAWSPRRPGGREAQGATRPRHQVLPFMVEAGSGSKLPQEADGHGAQPAGVAREAWAPRHRASSLPPPGERVKGREAEGSHRIGS